MENLLRSLRYQPDEGYGLCVRHQDPAIEKGERDRALTHRIHQGWLRCADFGQGVPIRCVSFTAMRFDTWDTR
jgi:hypothetical protein